MYRRARRRYAMCMSPYRQRSRFMARLHAENDGATGRSRSRSIADTVNDTMPLHMTAAIGGI